MSDEYYTKTGTKTINIEHADGTIVKRSVEIKDMKRHSKEVLKQLLANPKKIWSVDELRRLERW